MSGPNWNERYAAPGYFYGTEPNDFVVESEPAIPPGPVLCVAEGEGRNAVFLARTGRAVVAMDAAQEGLRKARALAAARGVSIETQVADLEAFDMGSDRWAGIVATWAHLPRGLRGRVHAAMVRALAPGGVLVLEAYTPAQLAFGTGGPRDVGLLMSIADLKGELAGLEFLVGREIERVVSEGQGHSGRSAVVQVLARRPGA